MTFVMGSDGRVYASGTIYSSTIELFEEISYRYNFRGRTLVLDSYGGQVLAAMTIGKMVRTMKMNTMVGKLVNGKYSPDATCESMCPFLFLAGVRRSAPLGTEMYLHQIRIGTKSPSDVYDQAEVFKLLKDAGTLMEYSTDMGATGKLMRIALSHSSYGELRKMTRSEMISTRLINK